MAICPGDEAVRHVGSRRRRGIRPPQGCELDRAGMAKDQVTVAGPEPVFGFGDEAAGDWVAMHVVELLDVLVVAENVEVVVAGLPEGTFGVTLRNGKFERLEGLEERDVAVVRFADEEVDVLGHDNVAENADVVACSRLF